VRPDRSLLDVALIERMLFLLRTRDAHGLYEPFGFERVSRPEEVMARLGSGAYG
jgi:hypothetical protein